MAFTNQQQAVHSSAAAETLAYFARLGERVEWNWGTHGRRHEALRDIASTALYEVPVPAALTPEVVLALLAASENLPKQPESSDPFGQPPAIMYRGPNLRIQALTWLDGTTSIHQHGFDGAFRVAVGSSLQVRYGFDREVTLADGHLVTGDLAMIESEILRTGDVRSIASGPEFVHALFHLECPSMTIVVRNGSSELPFPQYDYRIPGLGIDVLDPDDRLRMRLRGLHSLYRLDPDHAISVAREATAAADLWTAFRICDHWALSYGEGPELSALVEILTQREQTLGELLPLVYAEDVRRGRLLARRGLLRDPRHRLLLALIVNLPDKVSIQRAVRQSYPDRDPVQLIVEVVEEMASPEYRGISGLQLSPADLALLKAQLTGNETADILEVVASRWKPPSLLQKFFT